MNKTLLISSLFLATGITLSHAKAANYDIYVDDSSAESSPNGTQEKPFTKISEALKKASSGQSIFIASGTYNENLIIEKEVALIGQSKSSTILNGNGNETGIKLNASADISNLTVTNFNIGIYVSKSAGADIKSVKVSKNKGTGIEVVQGQTTEGKKVTVEKSDIEKNEKGFYIQKRKIQINDNRVISNRQEGIDIREEVKGTIKKNTISKNKESGVEFVIGSSKIKILNNKITGNSASGIASQFYKQAKKIGSIEIGKNKIQNNNHYGLQCGSPSGGNPSDEYWTKSMDLASNTFSGNQKSIAQRCGFPVALKK